ncbi:MAG: hypothetical protein IIA59_10810 [Candidatus Marinimicrobia bacterium]|nr:hypothetical protein [Candidatus Neomarinimicrobiota bacterium]
MKTNIIKVYLSIFAGLLIGCAAKEAVRPAAPALTVAPVAQPVEVRLGRVIAVDRRTFTLKDPADADRYETAVAQVHNPIWERQVPGWQLIVGKGERGVNAGRYVNLFNIETRDRRDYYAPVADSTAPAYSTAAFDLLNAEFEGNWDFDSTDFNFSDSVRFYTDYVLIGSDQIAEMPLVGLLGIHEVTNVEAGMEAAFETFIIEKYYPEFKKVTLPGVSFFVYKGDRGQRIGGYIGVWALESLERRNMLWPEPGSSSEEAAQGFAVMDSTIAAQLNSYFDPSDEGNYTDWVIIR